MQTHPQYKNIIFMSEKSKVFIESSLGLRVDWHSVHKMCSHSVSMFDAIAIASDISAMSLVCPD